MKEGLNAINISTSKSSSFDGISSKLIIPSSTFCLLHVTHLLNCCLSQGIFPCEWRRSLLTPLSKTSSPKPVSDTRPISKLPELSKILERLVHTKPSQHLDYHGLRDPRQAGFTPHHSIQSALLGVTDDIRRAIIDLYATIDQRKSTTLLLFDFSKAFDIIPHGKLIAKFRRLNLSNTGLR